MSRELGVLFKPDMHRAIIGRRKRQTRRLVKDLAVTGPNKPNTFDVYSDGKWVGAFGLDGRGNATSLAPYKVGDRLYIKEAWVFINLDSERSEVCLGYQLDGKDLPNRPIVKVKPEDITKLLERKRDIWNHRNQTPLFMPKWAARTWVEVTEVRIERLQDISEEGAKDEGVYQVGSEWVAPGVLLTSACGEQAIDWPCHPTAREAFKTLWQSINGYHSWFDNPWVWAYTFKLLPQERTTQ